MEAVRASYTSFNGGGKPGRTILTEEQRVQTKESPMQGASIRAIAKRIGVSWGVVNRALSVLLDDAKNV